MPEPLKPNSRRRTVRVRKVRNENRVGKMTLTATEVALAKKMGISLEKYAQTALVFIAKQRRWKWFFNRNKNEQIQNT